MLYESQPQGSAQISNLYVIDFDPNTGEIPTNTQGRFIGVQQQSGSLDGSGRLSYGAGWGLSAKGPAIYYSGLDPISGQYQLFRWYTNDTKPAVITKGPYPKLGGPLPTVNSQDPATAMIYLGNTSTAGTGATFVNSWTEGTPENSGVKVPLVPGGTEGPRWIENPYGITTRSIITTVKDANGVNQAARFDIDTNQITILTTDPTDKVDPKMLPAPEYNGEQIIITQLGRSKVAVYRQINNQWSLINTITVPYPQGQIPWLANPLPFAFGGRSYVALVAGIQSKGNTQTTEVWVLSLLDNSVQVLVSCDQS
jgi:hypothetical protein